VRTRSRLALVVVTAATAAGLVFACALPDTRYGAPGDLAAAKLPGTDTLACDAGAPLPGAEAGDAGEAVEAGAAGSCAVSWRSDLYAKMTTVWGCAASECHGPDAAAPLVDAKDASSALASLEAWQLSTHPGVPYVGKGGDFTQSTIDCNLGGFCTPTMPVLPAKQLTNDERCMLRTWLACGAPDN
jgi:hypothetical protein